MLSLKLIQMQRLERRPVELLKPIAESDNTTEFLMLTLQQAFNYEPAQVQELLTNSNQYLLQACDKGLQGSYEPIHDWLRLIIQNITELVQLFRVAYAKNSGVEVALVMSSVRSALFSQNETVVLLALEIIERVSDMLFLNAYEIGLQVKKGKKNQVTHVKVPIFHQLQQWFITPRIVQQQAVPGYMRKKAVVDNKGDPNSILRIICAEVLETHPHLSAAATRLILSVFREAEQPPGQLSLEQLPTLMLQMFEDDVFVAYNCLSMIMSEISQTDRGKLQLLIMNSSLMKDLLVAASEAEQDQAVRLLAMSLLVDLWHDEVQVVCNMDPQLRFQFYLCVEQALSHPDKVFKIAVLGQVFTLLNLLLDLKSAESPKLFQIVVQQCLQQIKKSEPVTESFILTNMLALFQQHQDLPLGIFIEPLVKHYSYLVQSKAALRSDQMSFVVSITKLQLLPATALVIIELLATNYVGKVALAAFLLNPLCQLIDHYQSDPKIIQFTCTILITKALASIVQLKASSSGRTQSVLAIQDNPSSIRYQSNTKRSMQVNRVEVTNKLKRFQMVNLIECLYELQIQKIESAVREQIRPLNLQYLQQHRSQSSAYEYLMTKFQISQQDPDQQALVLVESRPQTPQQNRREIELKRISTKHNYKSQMWTKAKEPTNDIALRAIEEMNTIKQQRIKKQLSDRVEEAKKQERKDQLHVMAANQLVLSKLILEKEQLIRKQQVREQITGELAQQSPFYEYILNAPLSQESRKESVLLQFSRVPQEGVLLVNFELDEEDRERNAMRTLVSRNQLLFQKLFAKYSKGKPTVQASDIQQYIKDFQIVIATKELMAMTKMINDIFLLRHQASQLEYPGFVQLIVQSSIFAQRKIKTYGLMAGVVMHTLKSIKETGAKRQEVYEVAGDEVKKGVQLQTVLFVHKIPESAKSVLGVPKSIALELLDELIQKQFQFSIFESVMQQRTTAAKKPVQPAAKKVIEPVQEKQKGKKAPEAPVEVIQPKKEPDYQIYNPQLLAKRFKPHPEKRSVKKDKVNEAIIVSLNMSAAIKIACFELQQVRPQADMDDMRDIAMVLELMLASVCGSGPYQAETGPKQGPRRKFLEQASSIKVDKAKDLEKKRLEEQKLEADKRSVEYMKRGLKLNQQLNQGQELDVKEMIQLRAKHVNSVVQKSKEQFLNRLKGRDKDLHKSQSQQALVRSNAQPVKAVPLKSRKDNSVSILPKLKVNKFSQFYLTKAVQETLSSFQLLKLYKEKCEFLIQSGQEVVRIQEPKFIDIFSEKQIQVGNAFQELCGKTEHGLSFEQFKQSTLLIALLHKTGNGAISQFMGELKPIETALITEQGLAGLLAQLTASNERADTDNHGSQLAQADPRQYQNHSVPDLADQHFPEDFVLDAAMSKRSGILDSYDDRLKSGQDVSINAFDDYRILDTPGRA